MSDTQKEIPKRIQRRRVKSWKMPLNTVPVGRPSIFGNQFKVVHFVSVATTPTHPAVDEWVVQTDAGSFTGHFKSKREAAEGVVALFRLAANEQTNSAESWRRKVKFALGGKDLACWCPLVDKDGNKVPCHADVLLEIANA
jgi:hypothetical protein